MLNYIKRIFPVFLAVSLFVTIVLLCCVRNSDDKINMSPTTANVGNSLTETSVSTKSHVFHSDEMRGIWVPYFNLSSGGAMTENEFKRHFDEIVNTAKAIGINALFVHVHSHCNSVYPSNIFPYSDIFTGEEGVAPDYDPLEYMIEKTHKAGLEFHAWINPYRVRSSGDNTPLCSSNPVYKWLNDSNTENDRNVIEYDGGLYLNPARAEVRSLIISGVRELVKNYDIDGVHFDDYFYPFTESEYDEQEYSEYLSKIPDDCTALTLTKWRCANVNVMVSGVYAAIKNIDKEIQFGISPQGNMENDIDMGADIYTWCGQKGFIDYIAPQIYYNSENPLLPYEQTVNSWRNIVTNDQIKLYIGMALYKAGGIEDDGTWQNSDTIIKNQIEYARGTNTDGFILYSWEYLDSVQTAAEVENFCTIL